MGTPSRGNTARTAASSGPKKNSNVRKEQNKSASRAYRERRKEKLALLEQLLEQKTQEASPSVPGAEPVPGAVSPQDTAGPSTSVVSSAEPSVSSALYGDLAVSDSSSTMFDELSFDSPWPVSHDALPFNMVFAGLDDGSGTQTVPRVHPTNQVLSSEASATPATTSQPLAAKQSAFVANGTKDSSSPALHRAWANGPTREEHESRDESLQAFLGRLMSLSTPDVKQIIYVQQNGLFGAIMENTLALGLLKGPQMIFSEDGSSPFNQDWVASRGGMQLADIKAKFAATPKDLQPLDIQITFEHHVYLDVLPFPSFREKALKALSRDPPLFDEDELCIDLTVNSGLVVWGSQGNNQGMDAGRSWDMRSWEPKPWFLRKYWFLCGGWEDEMWKAARWWHSMRNERIATRPPEIPTFV
ncbi:unnamed protein product [Discula destructiva]